MWSDETEPDFAAGPDGGLVDTSAPLQSFTDHTGDVIDLSWSASDFLLSASVDKTVRLWHVSR